LRSGQQVVEEILDAQRPGCPPEYFNIPIPKGDELYDKEGTGKVEIPFLRSRYDQGITGFSPNNPRQQVIEIPWIQTVVLHLHEVKTNCAHTLRRGRVVIKLFSIILVNAFEKVSFRKII